MKTRPLAYLAVSALLALTLVVGGCSSDTVNASQDATENTSAANTQIATSENAADHEDPADYEWNDADAVDVRLNENSAEADDASVKIDGSTVTIVSAGTYRFSGTLADGQIVVNAAADGTVRLILNGVNVTNSDGPAIMVTKAEKVVVALAGGTENSLADGSEYETTSADDQPNAALYCTSNLTIFGEGSLSVTGNLNDGIASKDGLILKSGTIYVQAVDDGIRGKDYLVVKDGDITVDAGGDGLKSDNADDVTMGYVSVAAGTLTVTAENDGIDAETDVIVTGGTLTITSGGGQGAQLVQDTSAKGIKGTVSVVIDDGAITVDAADDAIHSNDTITINGGTLALASNDDAVHADANLSVANATIDVTACYEGLESAVITVDSGVINIVSSDDGINAAGGNDGSGQQTADGQPSGDGFGRPGGGPGGGPGGDTVEDCYVYINGGTITLDSEGDGLDSNGYITMTGGTVVVQGPSRGGNGAIDWNGGFEKTGGTLVSGDVDMTQGIGSGSTQAEIKLPVNGSLAAGTLIHVVDSDGAAVLTFAPSKQYQTIVFSSPALVAGEQYEVYFGGSVSGADVSGLYDNDCDYTAGESVGSVAAYTP